MKRKNTISSLSFLFKIDDPLDAIPVHGAGGIWGTLAVYLFKWGGLFLSGSSEAATGLAWNVIGLIAIIAWTFIWAFTMFFVLKKFDLLRVMAADEFKGKCIFINISSSSDEPIFGTLASQCIYSEKTVTKFKKAKSIDDAEENLSFKGRESFPGF